MMEDHESEPWPSQLGHFVGVGFSRCDSVTEGHGLLVRRLEYYDFEEWNGNQSHQRNRASRNLFRMKYKAMDLERPSDAAPGLKAGINKHFVQRRYFEVDMQKKAFVLLGGQDIDEETTCPVGSYFHYGRHASKNGWSRIPESGGIGDEEDWWWYALPHRGMQFSLNYNNRILKNIDYLDRNTWQIGTAEQTVSYFISTPTVFKPNSEYIPTGRAYQGIDKTDELASGIAPSIDELQTLETWKKFFGSISNKFLDLGGGIARPLHYSTTISSVDHIDINTHVFTGMVQVTVSWPLSKMEVIDYLSSQYESKPWSPEWTPPAFHVINASPIHPPSFRRTHVVPSIPDNPQKRQVSQVWGTQTWIINGEYNAIFDLKNFPYDTQKLKVIIQTQTPCGSIMEFFQDDTLYHHHNTHSSARIVSNQEWKIKLQNVQSSAGFVRLEGKDELASTALQPSARFGVRDLLHRDSDTFNLDHVGDDMGNYEINLSLKIKRMSSVYSLRVIFPMGMFALLSIGTFSLDADKYAADRLAIPVSLLLTATAYSLTVAASIPKVGRLTVLERYILLTNLFIGLVCLNVTFLNWVSFDGYFDTGTTINADHISSIIALTLWIAQQLWFWLRVKYFRGVARKQITSQLDGEDFDDESSEKRQFISRSFTDFEL
eukprot:m.148574 g.148574  ORF g.148574 m.148574 type:complete len:659 (-) comp30607_c0_seq3:124-2100(-)